MPYVDAVEQLPTPGTPLTRNVQTHLAGWLPELRQHPQQIQQPHQAAWPPAHGPQGHPTPIGPRKNQPRVAVLPQVASHQRTPQPRVALLPRVASHPQRPQPRVALLPRVAVHPQTTQPRVALLPQVATHPHTPSPQVAEMPLRPPLLLVATPVVAPSPQHPPRVALLPGLTLPLTLAILTRLPRVLQSPLQSSCVGPRAEFNRPRPCTAIYPVYRQPDPLKRLCMPPQDARQQHPHMHPPRQQ